MNSNYTQCSGCGTTYHIKAGICPKCQTPEKALEAKYKKIAREMGDDQFFTKKELKHLPEILREGEEVEAFASGLMGNSTWLIALTDRRIIFLDKGMVYGLRQEIVDLNKVNSVSGKTGIIFGEITITDGAINRTIRNVPKQTVTPFTNKVQAAMEAVRSAETKPAIQVDDPIEKIEKLAKLKESGIISEEEFSQKKAELLASI